MSKSLLFIITKNAPKMQKSEFCRVNAIYIIGFCKKNFAKMPIFLKRCAEPKRGDESVCCVTVA